MGDTNLFENKTTYKFDDKIIYSLKQEEIEKLILQNIMILVYEYKNDCLTAGIKYKKTYYSDRDLKTN